MNDTTKTLGGQTLSTEDARVAIAGGDCRVLDLRAEEEFGEAHISGALNAPDAEELPEELPHDEPVIVVCADGERSATLADDLREKGVEAASIEGGMDSWLSDGLPVQPSIDFEA